MKREPVPEHGLFYFGGSGHEAALRDLVWRRLHALRRLRAAFQAQLGRPFEGRHVQKDFSRILIDAFHEAGFQVARFDGNAFLMSESADEYIVRIRRNDDNDPHWFPLVFRTPLDLEGAWRVVRRAERWLRAGRR